MKILTANFVTCAVKACKASPESFPLHFQDAELEQTDMEYNPAFLQNLLPRIEWEALRTTAAELGFTNLPDTKPDYGLATPAAAPPVTNEGAEDVEMAGEGSAEEAEAKDKVLRDLHRLLMETEVVEGKMVCGKCGHEYKIKEGIANFLLPNHLV